MEYASLVAEMYTSLPFYTCTIEEKYFSVHNLLLTNVIGVEYQKYSEGKTLFCSDTNVGFYCYSLLQTVWIVFK